MGPRPSLTSAPVPRRGRSGPHRAPTMSTDVLAEASWLSETRRAVRSERKKPLPFEPKEGPPLTIDELQARAVSFTPEDLAQIITAAQAYAVSRGYGAKAVAYAQWYVESNTLDENAGWNSLPEHPETFASWIVP